MAFTIKEIVNQFDSNFKFKSKIMEELEFNVIITAKMIDEIAEIDKNSKKMTKKLIKSIAKNKNNIDNEKLKSIENNPFAIFQMLNEDELNDFFENKELKNSQVDVVEFLVEKAGGEFTELEKAIEKKFGALFKIKTPEIITEIYNEYNSFLQGNRKLKR